MQLLTPRHTRFAKTVRLAEDDFRRANLEQTGERLYDLARRVGNGRLSLDLADVSSITSLGLGKLVGLYKRLLAAGGRLTLLNLCPMVYDVFQITRLANLFDIR